MSPLKPAIESQRIGRTLRQMAGADDVPPKLVDSTLIIIDAQGEYRDGALPLEGIELAVSRLAQLLAEARRVGATVVHVAHRGRPGGLFDRDSTGGAFLAELGPAAGERIVEKTLPNAFAATDLADQIGASTKPHLVVTGFMTHMCVSSTVRAALDLGFAVTVAGDATATRGLPDPLGGPDIVAADLQRASLAALADRFAAVVPSAMFL